MEGNASSGPGRQSEPIGREPGPGTAIARYRLTRLHSSGGQGRVWLADDPHIGREVALKELLSEKAAEPRARARFLREAQITGQLEHPNIVPVYEVGEFPDGGRPFYAMRFVRGVTLQEAIQKEFADDSSGRLWPRSRRGLLRALVAVSNAVAHAHSRGIVHRDLKPENIILGRFGEQILLDWGLAKRLGEESLPEQTGDSGLIKTSVGSVQGTIAYMSPEQAAGRDADQRTDIYGLGAILFEVLTGRAPHVGESVIDVLRQIVEGQSPQAKSVNSQTPKALNAICIKAMAKRPEERYANAREVVEDLERWLSDEAVTARPDSTMRGFARWVRRHQGLAFASSIALIVVVAISTLAAIWLGAAAERERGLKERSMRSSAELAALAVGREIDLRWYILQNSAEDEELREALSQMGGDDTQLMTWIGREYAEHQNRTRALSWIVMDLQGTQRARHPEGSSIGGHYGFRDYFHGKGRDLSPEQAVGVAPIRDVHRSVVFRSTVTDNLMVAFSVPIWDTDGADHEVLGVLGMTVELGGFGFEEMQLDENQMVVLIDTVPDNEGRGGLVLQHAQLSNGRPSKKDVSDESAPRYYVSRERLAKLRELREAKSERIRRLEKLTPEERLSRVASGPVTLMDANYRDPVKGVYDGSWLAAFEPVLVKGRTRSASDTGWVVIVQERNVND